MKSSFILYTEQKAVIDKLTDEQAGKLIKAIYAHETGAEYELDAILDLVITPFLTSLDRNNEKYQKRVDTNKKNIAKRWNTNDTNGTNGITNDTNDTNGNDSDSVSDNVSVSDSESDSVSSSAEEDNKQPPQSWISCYEQNIGLVNGIVVEQIESYEMTDEVVEEAIKEAVKNDVRRLNYILAILQDYKDHNIKTKADVEARRVEFEKKKQKKPHNKDKPTNAYVDTNSEEYKDLEGYYIT